MSCASHPSSHLFTVDALRKPGWVAKLGIEMEHISFMSKIKLPSTHNPCSVLSAEESMWSKSLATLWIITSTVSELEIFSTSQEVFSYPEITVMLALNCTNLKESAMTSHNIQMLLTQQQKLAQLLTGPSTCMVDREVHINHYASVRTVLSGDPSTIHTLYKTRRLPLKLQGQQTPRP